MRLLARLVFLAVVMSVSLIASKETVFAADGIWDKCPYPDGKYYQPVFPAFRHRSIQILHESDEKLVETVETNVDSATFIGWSPDCRYISAGLGPLTSNQTVIWNIIENRRVGTFQRKAKNATHRLYWENTAQYVIVQTLGGAYLWNLTSQQQILLPNTSCGFQDIHWDLARHQLLGVAIEDEPTRCFWYYRDDGVRAYDLNTGQEVFYFGNPGHAGAHFDVSPDGTKLKVYGNEHAPFGSTVWNRDVHTIESVDVEKFPNYDSLYASTSQLSPDGKYIAAFYDNTIAVYDMTRSPTIVARTRKYLPLRYFSIAGASNWKFATPTSIEIQYAKPPRTRHYDLLIGRLLD